MSYLYALIALDIARERSEAAMERARLDRLIRPNPQQPRRSVWHGLRSAAARTAAIVSVGSARVARRIDDCAASEVLVDVSHGHAA